MARKESGFIYRAEKALGYILDTIAPPDPLSREIELSSVERFCGRAKRSEKALEGILSLFSYKDPFVRTAILEVKSYGNKKIARLLGAVAYEYLIAELSDLEAFEGFTRPLLLTVPLTKKSLRARGYNQCDLVADGILVADRPRSIEVRKDILVKSRETGDQVGKTRKERFENLKGCFDIADERDVRGRNVIVLDDIATTGATLGEAKRALRRAGARKILCVALAH
jgi:competence protein ComFC